MQYLLLINDDEQFWTSMSEDERNAAYAAYGQYTQELQSRGILVAADQLQPSSTATVVSVRNGETIVTDGPFAETKEVLGGYYQIEVDTLDEALEWAAKIPSASRNGYIEVRPIVMRTAEVSA
ncbi:MAG: YciI family protein [Actinobacteria bacterium]|nr:YciI family protein [Actinomycetota bacterium]MBV8562461.1 YciI family protein [Actinomycetota bacterium]